VLRSASSTPLQIDTGSRPQLEDFSVRGCAAITGIIKVPSGEAYISASSFTTEPRFAHLGTICREYPLPRIDPATSAAASPKPSVTGVMSPLPAHARCCCLVNDTACPVHRVCDSFFLPKTFPPTTKRHLATTAHLGSTD
jgi:hypothetical protein